MIPPEQPLPGSDVPLARRVVTGDDLWGVNELPAGGGEVKGDEFLLAPDKEVRLESSHREQRLAPDHSGAGEEAGHAPPAFGGRV
jgi:hypothetical protein